MFTRSRDASIPEVVPLKAGAARSISREALVSQIDAFVAAAEASRRREGLECAVVHSHYWLSNLVALELRRRWGVPVIQMFHTLGALKSAVAGTPREREPEARLVAVAGIAASVDRIGFRGPQSQARLPDYCGAADLCLRPSRYESFGIVALEAMACGVPVVASRVGGLTVTVQDGVTGVLVPEGDVGRLASAITGLLADEGRRRALGRHAVDWARRLAWPHVTRAVAERYGELAPALRGIGRPSRCQSLL